MQNNHDNKKVSKATFEISTDHGIPEQIINDKNKLFTLKSNTNLRNFLGIKF